MKNMMRSFVMVAAVVAFAFAANWVASASAQAGLTDNWCMNNDNLCIGQDGQTRVKKPVEHRVVAQTAMEVSTSVKVAAGYVTVTSSGGVVEIAATPSVKITYETGRSIATGTELIIRGTSDANAIILKDDDTLAGSKLELGAATRTLGLNDVLKLIYDSAAARWLEVSYSDLN